MTSIRYGPPRGFPGSPPRLGGRSSSCWCFAGKWLQLPDSPVRLYLFVVCYHQSQVCEVKLIPQFFGELVEGHMPVCNIRVEAGYKSGERCWGLMFPDPESSPASSSPGSVGDVKDGRVGWVAELLPSKPKKIIARVQQVQRMKDMIWYDMTRIWPRVYRICRCHKRAWTPCSTLIVQMVDINSHMCFDFDSSCTLSLLRVAFAKALPFNCHFVTSRREKMRSKRDTV